MKNPALLKLLQAFAKFSAMFSLMFKKRAGGLYCPDKTRPASLLKDFKIIPGVARLEGVDNNDAFVNIGN